MTTAAPTTPTPSSTRRVRLVVGDLLDQPVDAVVNAWNRNVIPWWLLLPQGVCGAIKRKVGTAPFRERARHGPMPLGAAVATTAGRLPFRAIIHVAGINLLWRSSECAVRDSVRNALQVATDLGVTSLALPLIGAGSGGMPADRAEALILNELEQPAYDAPPLAVRVVRYKPPKDARHGP